MNELKPAFTNIIHLKEHMSCRNETTICLTSINVNVMKIHVMHVDQLIENVQMEAYITVSKVSV